MNSTFNPKTFVENSYREYHISNNNLYKLADKFYQKRIKDETGKTKYVINVYHYLAQFLAQFTYYDNSTFEVAYSTEDYEYRVEISSCNFSTFEQMENFFEEHYKANNCIPDKHNND